MPPPAEGTRTGETATTARPVLGTSRSNPPPATKGVSSIPPAPRETEDEIDAQFERLEFGALGGGAGPTGPVEAVPSITLDDTAATQARPRGAPPIPPNANGASKRPPDLSFGGNRDEATESGQIVPPSIRGGPSRPPPSSMDTQSAGAGATDRPMQSTDPNLPFLGEPEPGPMTLVGDNPLDALDAGVETSPGGTGTPPPDDDFEDPTGADMKVDLESTNPGSDANILIADDLADSMDEETGTSPTVPPYRQGS
jgi:hypothetical protein